MNKHLMGSEYCTMASWAFSSSHSSAKLPWILREGEDKPPKKWVGLPKVTWSEKDGAGTQTQPFWLQIRDNFFGFTDTLFKIKSREKVKSGSEGRTSEDREGLQESPDVDQGTTED